MNRIRLIALIGLTLCFLFGILRARAAEPADDLIARLAAIDGLQGRFEQRQFDEDGALVRESGGRFRLLRPGYFLWDITTPDSQLVIADPAFVWHYDRDLETVTRRPVAGSVDASPLQVLGGDTSVLRERFRVQQPESGRFILTSDAEAGSFRELTLGFDGDTIRTMEIINSLNQRIEIEFLETDPSSKLHPDDFLFSPPPGVDLFYYDE
jgi:outer membrane lipoprotein carrier protein